MSTNEAKKALAAAMAHHQAGRLAEAEPLYRAVIERQQRNADALHFLGVLLHHTGRLDEARDLMARSIELSPSSPHFYANFAELLRALGKPAAAVGHARSAVRLNPNDADAHHSLGMALRDSGDHAGAIASFESALRLRPNHAAAMGGMGSALLSMGKTDEAIRVLERAAAQAGPRGAETANQLGMALVAKGRFEEGVAAFDRALAVNPSFADAYNNRGNALLEIGALDAAIAMFEKAMAVSPQVHQAGSNRLMALNYRDAFTPAEEVGSATSREASARLFSAHVEWAQQFAQSDEPVGGAIERSDASDRGAARRLRIGYVSPDFRFHSVALFIEPLLAHHDRAAFEIFCYSNVKSPDAMTDRFKSLADHWRPIAHLDDASAAKLVRDDKIDILIDLAGHTSGNLLLLFARRPAPVQVAYLGWQNTTGMASIDARITDSLVDPPGVTDAFHTEKLLRLPKTFAVYQPRPDAPEVGSLPALKNGFVTFGSVSKISKITPAVMALWARATVGIERSKLLMIATGLQSALLRARLTRIFGEHGIAADRLEFVPEVSFAEYMNLHGRIDILLDTFPFNGHTTTCHGLWMGVPTMTLAGDRYASRMGLSVMSNVGQERFVANSERHFVEALTGVCADLPTLAQTRAESRERLKQSAVMDYDSFARAFEAILQQLWRI